MSDTRERAAKLAHVLWTHEGNGSGPEIWKAAATVLLLEFAQSLEAEVAANSYGAALTERYGEFEADRVCLINVTTSIKSLHGVCIIEPDKEFQGCKICWTRREAEGQIRKLNALLKLQPPRVEETDLKRAYRADREHQIRAKALEEAARIVESEFFNEVDTFFRGGKIPTVSEWNDEAIKVSEHIRALASQPAAQEEK